MDAKQSIIRAIQRLLGVNDDGVWGPKTQAALNVLVSPNPVQHSCAASSFADPRDVARYHWAIERGESFEAALAIGDNGVGYWKDPTVEGSGPCCALPPEDIEEKWGTVDDGKHKEVLVSNEDHQVTCLLKDIMPRREHLTTRARIDLNPDACTALGLTPPVMAPVVWSWV